MKIDTMGRSYRYRNGKRIAHYLCAKGHDKRLTGKDEDGRCGVCKKEKLRIDFIDFKTNDREAYIQKGRRSNWNARGILNSDGRIFTTVDRDHAYQVQQGCCKICGVHESELKLILVADHDHKTKVFRGLLCNRCNSAIGLFGESKESLKKALEYLG